jgi:hypothetical protein
MVYWRWQTSEWLARFSSTKVGGVYAVIDEEGRVRWAS